jgi:hypothetical protein
MILGQVFERFIEESPVSVMVRGLMEKFLSPQKRPDDVENALVLLIDLMFLLLRFYPKIKTTNFTP